MMLGKIKAKRFIKTYKLRNKKFWIRDIEGIITSQGFEIIEYSHQENIEFVDDMLIEFELKDYSLTVKSFLQSDEHNRIVFILEDLNEDDRFFRLCHEEYHIFDEHGFKKGYFEYSDVQKEKASNEFASYLYEFSRKPKLGVFFFVPTLAITIFLSSIISFTYKPPIEQTIAPPTANCMPPDSSMLPGYIMQKKVRVLDTRTIFHNPNCDSVSGKDYYTEMTVETALNVGHIACKRCMPLEYEIK